MIQSCWSLRLILAAGLVARPGVLLAQTSRTSELRSFGTYPTNEVPMPGTAAEAVAAASREASEPARDYQSMRLPGGELRYRRGDGYLTQHNRRGKLLRRLPLARAGYRNPPGTSLFAALPKSGRHYLVVLETREDFGLHLRERRAALKPRAVVSTTLLRLMDEDGRLAWESEIPESTTVADPEDQDRLQIARNGTAAILLQDVDPFSRGRGVLHVVGPRGGELLTLDHGSWPRIREFALSEDGRHLAVRGRGSFPEEGVTGEALGYYKLGDGLVWVKPAADVQARRPD